jgi:lysophospholipase L1-like esterase
MSDPSLLLALLAKEQQPNASLPQPAAWVTRPAVRPVPVANPQPEQIYPSQAAQVTPQPALAAAMAQQPVANAQPAPGQPTIAPTVNSAPTAPLTPPRPPLPPRVTAQPEPFSTAQQVRTDVALPSATDVPQSRAIAPPSIYVPPPRPLAPPIAPPSTYLPPPHLRQPVQPPPPPPSGEAVQPRSGSQLYVQRISALRAGRLYTRLPMSSFQAQWRTASGQPTYEQWQRLLAQEANVVARWQNGRRLSVIVGDSISLWYPSNRLPNNQLWLNQAVSGETTKGVLRRLPVFSNTKPNTIYVMAGINDLRRGVADDDIVRNLWRITRTLKRNHPQAQVVLQSILPTRLNGQMNDRIGQINRRLAAIAQHEQVTYLDLYADFADAEGNLRPELTTDGLHLSQQGYATWASVFQQGLIAQQ